MNISNKFDEQPWASQLARRRANFRLMCQHIEDHPQLPLVVETGTAWDKGNWDGQGQSTLIWDWLVGELGDRRALSIDIRQESTDMAKAQTKNVSFITGDSVKTLASLEDVGFIGLLYLDSYDWTPELNMESSFHHIAELATIYAKLQSGCMIVVDDRHGNFKGKHWMVEAFFKQLEIKPAFKNHQIGWIKP